MKKRYVDMEEHATVFEDEWLKIFVDEIKPKTKVFDVMSKCGDCSLSLIAWHNAWRHYCFFPKNNTVHSDRCLMAIAGFITRMNIEHKIARSTLKSDEKVSQ